MAYSTVGVNTMFALWACSGTLFAAGHRFLQTRKKKKIANQHTGLHSYAAYTSHNSTYVDGGELLGNKAAVAPVGSAQR